MSGSVRIFGQVPGAKESDIPGPGVGYMPQELALFGLLTINEVLHYYGRLYGMDPDVIRERVQKFITLLNLPTKHRRVSQLSGGQQRRVSLAVTLIHRPPLLILDEPTVGVDSLLRCRIWNYLEELCTQEATTVIITTHYTEEAKGAFRVGFIDSGSLLAQDNPANLLHKYNCISLEDVFLELCLQKTAIRSTDMIEEVIEVDDDVESNNNNNNNDAFVDASDKNNNNNDKLTPNAAKLNLNGRPTPQKKMYKRSESTSLVKNENEIEGTYFNCHRLNSLLKKNYILFRRNPVSIILLNVLPLFQMLLFAITFGRSPRNVPVSIVNHDANATNSLSNVSFCRFMSMFGFVDRFVFILSKQIFLSKLSNETLHMINYPSIEDGVQSVHDAKSWLVIAFPNRFSRNFKKRFLKQEHASNKVINGSKIMMYPDNSQSFFAIFTMRMMLNAFEDFVKEVGGMMGFNPRFFGSPLDIMKPIYGTMDINFGEFITAGMIISIVHGMATLIGSFSVVRERNDGHLERGFVAGIKPAEVILSHIIFLILPILSQVMLTVAYVYYKLDNYETLASTFVIVFMQAIQGMLFGVVISTVCPSELASLVSIVIILSILLVTTDKLIVPFPTTTADRV